MKMSGKHTRANPHRKAKYQARYIVTEVNKKRRQERRLKNLQKAKEKREKWEGQSQTENLEKQNME